VIKGELVFTYNEKVFQSRVLSAFGVTEYSELVNKSVNILYDSSYNVLGLMPNLDGIVFER